MKNSLRQLKLLCTLCAFFFASSSTGFSHATSTAWQSADHIKVRLVSDLHTLAPSTTFYIGLELIPEEHWHVYWQNPGDSGMPVSINWALPDDLSEEKIIWPIPEKIPFGHLTNYGYEGRVIVPARMQSSDKLNANVTLQAKANWLVCKDTCIPGSANFELTMETGQTEKRSEYATSLHHFVKQEAMPLELMSGEIKEKDAQLTMQLFAAKPLFSSAKKISFFPINESLFKAGADTEIHWKNNFLTLSQEKSESYYKLPATIRGLLVVDDKHAWEFTFNTQP